MDEENLVKLAQNHNKESFSKLINMYKKDLYVVAKSKLDNDADIEDAIQETLFNAYKNIDKLKDTSNFKAWIIRILINNCKDILRDKDNKIYSFTDINNVTDGLNEYEEIDHELDFFKMIDFLSSEDKLLITLKYSSELNTKDISKIMNIREGTIRMKFSRIISKIKERYEGGK